MPYLPPSRVYGDIMEHKMMHDNEHGTANHSTSSRALKIALVIVLALMVAEVIGGILSNSLALLGDAGHMLVDALALGLSLFAATIAGRPATQTKTYGYHRIEIIAALVNSTALVLVTVYIFYESYHRFVDPPTVKIPIMLLIASLGLIANLAGIFLLKSARHRSLNIKAAFWHVAGDTLSSVGVIIAGIIIYITDWSILDPIIAVFIGCIILWGAVRIFSESVDIIMEAVPKHIQINEVIDMIKGIPGVVDVHDIHIWAITSGVNAMNVHLVVEDQTVSRSAEIVERVNQNLSEHFNIDHVTIQLECKACPVKPIRNSHSSHAH